MPQSNFIVSTPFTGYGILIAVDILTSAGSLAELPALLELVSGGSEVIEEPVQYWSSAPRQWKMMAERFQHVGSTVDARGATTGCLHTGTRPHLRCDAGLENGNYRAQRLDSRRGRAY
jgi:hypothetical protein